MEKHILNIAVHLEHRDCLALEVCCKSFRSVLLRSNFHTWTISHIKTAYGYKYEEPNGNVTHEVEIVPIRKYFIPQIEPVPDDLKIAVVSRMCDDNKRLLCFYNFIDNKEWELAGFFYDKQLWHVEAYTQAILWWPRSELDLRQCISDDMSIPFNLPAMTLGNHRGIRTFGDLSKHIFYKIEIDQTKLETIWHDNQWQKS